MQRRTFLKWATHGLGALFAAVLGVPAVAYLIDARNRPARAGAFKTVANVHDLQVGVPKQVTIRETWKDAWTLHPDDVIGRVWLILQPDGQTVVAFTTVCPHKGCSVNFEGTKKLFLCPCHNGTFALDGKKVDGATTNPAPRGMDELECRRDPADPDLVQVKYETFMTGEPTKQVRV
jgi:Rieske Fe-S protein